MSQQPYELPKNQDPIGSKYVMLEGIEEGNQFISRNCPKDNEYSLARGGKREKCFVILGYASTIAEAQIFLYGRSETDCID